MKVTEYAVVDIDDDGYNEIVAYLDSKIGLVEVFHYEDEKVYGYQLPSNVKYTYKGHRRANPIVLIFKCLQQE